MFVWMCALMHVCTECTLEGFWCSFLSSNAHKHTAEFIGGKNETAIILKEETATTCMQHGLKATHTTSYPVGAAAQRA